jgi:hypothetical protein
VAAVIDHLLARAKEEQRSAEVATDADLARLHAKLSKLYADYAPRRESDLAEFRNERPELTIPDLLFPRPTPSAA